MVARKGPTPVPYCLSPKGFRTGDCNDGGGQSPGHEPAGEDRSREGRWPPGAAEYAVFRTCRELPGPSRNPRSSSTHGFVDEGTVSPRQTLASSTRSSWMKSLGRSEGSFKHCATAPVSSLVQPLQMECMSCRSPPQTTTRITVPS